MCLFFESVFTFFSQCLVVVVFKSVLTRLILHFTLILPESCELVYLFESVFYCFE